ncbi:ATPase [Methanosarcinales archaeon]|nr:MAG: ATPase [Methanosarcinales archaeon]
MSSPVPELVIVPDTSVVIDGRITSKIREGSYEGAVLLVPEAVVAELEAQANRGKEAGFNGLGELQELVQLSKTGVVKLEYVGRRPGLDDVRLASGGEIDALIRETAIENGALLVTGDRIQAEVGRAKGLRVEYLPPEREEPLPLGVEEYFTEYTLSVHLKEGAVPLAKRGSVGDQMLVRIDDTPLGGVFLKDLAREILERAKRDKDGFVEIDHGGATVVQLGNMRIAIARPPFSDGLEITAVRPVARVLLEDYRLGSVLEERLTSKQRGVLVAGPPGSGKSTLAGSIADHLMNDGYIVKTIESPRDLQVPPAVTQYSPLSGDVRKTAEVLLLVRPDYTIHDEVRSTRDFQVFADMRLAGVGMIGVIHASRAIDAVQRFIGRMELGVIPQVVDTVIYLEAGEVVKVYELRFTVKVPSGMFEEDLARPTILVEDFETSVQEYEIYTYGEQVIVMPVGPEEAFVDEEMVESLRAEVKKYVRGSFEVKMSSPKRGVILCRDSDVPLLIGRKGRNIENMERRLGMRLDVRPTERELSREDEDANIEFETTKKHLVLHIPDFAGEMVEILIDDLPVLTAAVGRRGDIRLPKKGQQATALYRAMKEDRKITIR